MKSYWFAIGSAVLAINLTALGENMLSSEKDRISYGIGMDIGRNITNRQVDINPDALAAGLKAIVNGSKPLLNDEEYRQAMTGLQAQMQAKQAERMKQMEAKNKEAADKTKKEGQAF
ncbi:MAG TPA: FKBP-type peptidyl-prolyl cis-trans isomerase N-terminal domain-containing protein, partial [Candidatus Sulfotelmatobacter sp.]|nr:FKBP-type peptidyl-prolyl cis-trans isomerase N-terminal domain-containing protein [Candidatus Sulfotelmatobacter sp.]